MFSLYMGCLFGSHLLVRTLIVDTNRMENSRFGQVRMDRDWIKWLATQPKDSLIQKEKQVLELGQDYYARLDKSMANN